MNSDTTSFLVAVIALTNLAFTLTFALEMNKTKQIKLPCELSILINQATREVRETTCTAELKGVILL